MHGCSEEPRLILTADDFGISSTVNEAVIRTHREGVLTSVSLMVAGEAFEEAVRLAKENPNLEVGLHVVCIDGKAVLSPSQVQDIVDQRGYFSSNAFALGTQYFFNRKAQEQLRRELRAQFEKFASTGLVLSHVDSHWHFHMHPTLFPMIVELAEEFGAKRLRIPRDNLSLSLRRSRKRLLWKLVTALEFAWLNRRAVRQLGNTPTRQLTTPDHVFGLFDTGAMDEATLLEAIEFVKQEPETLDCNEGEDAPIPDAARQEIIEIYCHPNTVSSASSPSGPEELQALLSPKVLKAMQPLR